MVRSHNPADITLWEVPGAGHCGAVNVVPQEFDHRVVVRRLGWSELKHATAFCVLLIAAFILAR